MSNWMAARQASVNLTFVLVIPSEAVAKFPYEGQSDTKPVSTTLWNSLTMGGYERPLQP